MIWIPCWELTSSNRRPSDASVGMQWNILDQKKLVHGYLNQKKIPIITIRIPAWELTGSNRRPSACKADALNQLS